MASSFGTRGSSCWRYLLPLRNFTPCRITNSYLRASGDTATEGAASSERSKVGRPFGHVESSSRCEGSRSEAERNDDRNRSGADYPRVVGLVNKRVEPRRGGLNRLEVPSYAEGFDCLYRVRLVGQSDYEITALPS